MNFKHYIKISDLTFSAQFAFCGLGMFRTAYREGAPGGTVVPQWRMNKWQRQMFFLIPGAMFRRRRAAGEAHPKTVRAAWRPDVVRKKRLVKILIDKAYEIQSSH